MIEAIRENAFDLEKVINATFIELDTEKRRQADYILTTFAEKYDLDVNLLRQAVIKVVELYNVKTKKINQKKQKSKKVIKYFIMTEKDKLNILKEITIITKVGMNKTITRDIKILEPQDLVNLGYTTPEGKICYTNPAIKKLGLKYNTDIDH